MGINWQWIIVGILLMVAVVYVFRVVKKSFGGKHDCPDCEIPVQKKPKHFKAYK